MIRPAVCAGLSVLIAAWSAEGATVYRRAAARPAGALAVLGGPAAKPGAVIGGPAEPKARLPGASGSAAPGESKLHKRHAAAAPGAPRPEAAGAKSPQAVAPVVQVAPSEPAGRSDRRAARR